MTEDIRREDAKEKTFAEGGAGGGDDEEDNNENSSEEDEQDEEEDEASGDAPEVGISNAGGAGSAKMGNFYSKVSEYLSAMV